MFLAEKGDKRIFLNLAHIDEVKWSGGKYRSTQTKEIFENAGYDLQHLRDPLRPGKWQLLLLSLVAIVKFGIYRPFCIASLRTSGFLYFYYSYWVNHYPYVNTYLIEGTGFGTLQAVAMLKAAGKKVILLPINVESLAPYPDAWTHTISPLERLREETKYYISADAVFCISLEEEWLLSILGAKTYSLLYYPPMALMERIELRRAKRLNSVKQGLFYYANFYNSPNFLGFKQFVEEGLYKGKIIKVAGIGSEKVKPLVKSNPSFILLGEISEEEMEQQLISCEKVVFNHFPTSGMLTRIPELLLSGIPVTGNAPALKAYGMLPVEDGVSNDMLQSMRSRVDLGTQRLLSMIED